MKKILSILLTLCIISILSAADGTWTNGNFSNVSNDAANWSEGVSNPDGNITLTTGWNDGNELGINSNLATYSVRGITVTAGVDGYITSAGGSTDNISIGAGGITLLGDGTSLEVLYPILTSADQIWNIGSGALIMRNPLLVSHIVDVNIGVGGSILFASTTSFQSWTGMINFTGDVSNIMTVASSGLGAEHLQHMRINGQEVVLDGLNLVAIPEPATYAGLFGLGALAVVMYRRRKS